MLEGQAVFVSGVGEREQTTEDVRGRGRTKGGLERT